MDGLNGCTVLKNGEVNDDYPQKPARGDQISGTDERITSLEAEVNKLQSEIESALDERKQNLSDGR